MAGWECGGLLSGPDDRVWDIVSPIPYITLRCSERRRETVPVGGTLKATMNDGIEIWAYRRSISCLDQGSTRVGMRFPIFGSSTDEHQ